MFLARTLVVPSLQEQEEVWHLISPPERNAKAQPEEGYNADKTQQPEHIKASKPAPTKLRMPLCVAEEEPSFYVTHR